MSTDFVTGLTLWVAVIALAILCSYIWDKHNGE